MDVRESAKGRPLEFDVDFARAHFPALNESWAFFDNAGGSQILQPVIERIAAYLTSSNVQLGASYAVSQLAGRRLRQATDAVATLLNARDRAEVVMGGSTTMLLRILADSFGRWLKPGDEIVVTNADHEANIGPWLALQRYGMVPRFWKLRPQTYELDLDDLARVLGPRTRLVAMTHVSNVLGRINPVRQVAELVHDAGALLCVDGVAYAPHRAVDVRELDVDFYALSAYKVYGPHHAVLWGRRDLLRQLPGSNHFFVADDDIPYKFQPGNINYELSYGMLGVLDYLEDLASCTGGPGSGRGAVVHAFAAMAAHEEKLARRLLEYLLHKPGVSVLGPSSAAASQRVPTISFRVAGRQSAAVVGTLDRHRIGTRYGHFYSRRLLADLGLDPDDGVVRVSMVHYNTVAEVDRLIGVLDEII